MKVCVLISGDGSNLQAIINAKQQQKLNIEILCVISDRFDAYGLKRAAQNNIPHIVCPKEPDETREHYDQKLYAHIKPLNPDMVILAGFMRILTAPFIAHFTDKILNVHPALLPDFKGLNTHKNVVMSHQKQHGCSIHIVTPELDSGPVLRQLILTVHGDDTATSLKQRVHKLEHLGYVEVLHLIQQQYLTIHNGRPFWHGHLLHKPIVTYHDV